MGVERFKKGHLSMKKIFRLFSFLVAFFLFASLAFAYPQKESVVKRVVDGDTFVLKTGEKIRLIGVDTPEYDLKNHQIRFYGKEASEYSKKLLLGQTVRLEPDVKKKDKYNRFLAYVYLKNGTFVNLHLVEEGYAKARYYAPNGRYRKLFTEAEKKAKNLRKGLWNTSDHVK
jgi:micrococcal nuclease